MPPGDITFGYPEEWTSFRARNGLFLERFENLTKAFDKAFIRDFQSQEPIDRFVMMFGRMCIEEFFEILLLCGNGYGIAASRLLRALWEKVVTLEYIDAHPEELDAFFDYHHISQHKLLKSVQDVIGMDALPAEIIAENDADYERVKQRFMVTACKTCGTKRVNHSWNKLDIVAMAKKTRILGKIVNEAYYLPLAHTHSSMSSLIQRLEERETGAIGFNPDSQQKTADSTLRTSHLIVVELLLIQTRRYKIPDLETMVEKCEKDWIEIYKKRRGEDGGT